MDEIRIESIPGEIQRYPTCGDYRNRGPYIQVSVTEQDNEDYEFLIAIHELIEWWITKKRGISEESITDYDMDWENKPQPKADEPGNEPGCPYSKEHRFAENIERQIAHEIGINWDQYSKDLKI